MPKASNLRNIPICQNYIEERVKAIQQRGMYTVSSSAFQILTASVLFDMDYDEVSPEDIVDSKQDKQIDIIHVEDNENARSAHIHIVQVKNVKGGFSSNLLLQIENGLRWIFEQADYGKLNNSKFVYKIGEIRDLWREYGSSNLDISVYLVTNGDTEQLSDEYLQQRDILVNRYCNFGFNSFSFQDLGAYELVERMNEIQRAKKKIDADISIVYDQNQASLIEFYTGNTKAVICTITGDELARISNLEENSIFDLNLRPYQGMRGAVNTSIRQTATSESDSPLFWFLNNGVTMVCDNFDVIRIPGNQHIKVKNVQIVNGCQTTVTLRDAKQEGQLRANVQLLARIYATSDPTLTERITLTTNNQNRITERDLRANDEVQRNIQTAMMEQFGYTYERKTKEIGELRGERKKYVIPNHKAAQAYYAIVRKRPSIARGFPGRVWADYYDDIFQHATVEDLLACYKVYGYCYEKSRSQSNQDATLPNLESEVAVYGTFHIARIIGCLVLKDKWGNENREDVARLIRNMENDDSYLEESFNHASQILSDIWNTDRNSEPNNVTLANPTLYFKAERVQQGIERKLIELRPPEQDEAAPNY